MNDETVIGLDLLTATIKDLQEALSDGKVTSVQLIQTYLDRIEANNKKGLELRAVMETAPRKQLMEIARARDEMRANRASIGPLHGIPILVKDNIATHPALGMNTTAGSYALLKSIPMEDATVIAKLRSAGAIILGKATMNEFANLKAFNAIEGWSARGGRGRSAYDVGGHGSDGAKPSGSSSGSAIAVSAGFSPAALGTETSGSLISPAGRAAAYTLRSTAGLVSRYGVIPGCKSFDTIGPITKSAWDTAVLLSCMAGLDPKDEATKDAEFPANKDYTRFTEMPYATFKGKRLGFPGHGAFDLDIPWGNDIVRSPAIKDALAAALEKMASLGAIVCDQAEIPSFPEWKALATSTPKYGLTIIAHEFKEDIEGYLATMQSTEVRNLQDIIDFNLAHPELELPLGQSEQDVLTTAQSTAGRTAQAYLDIKAKVKRLCQDEGIDKVMDQFQLDALVLPLNAIAAGYASGGRYPLAVVPLGVQENGEPFGFCFLGRKWSEPMLIALMAAYEASFPPRALPSTLLKDGTATGATIDRPVDEVPHK